MSTKSYIHNGLNLEETQIFINMETDFFKCSNFIQQNATDIYNMDEPQKKEKEKRKEARNKRMPPLKIPSVLSKNRQN
jgi:hypothetical protein